MSFIPRQILSDLSIKFSGTPAQTLDARARLAVRQGPSASNFPAQAPSPSFYQRVENEFKHHPVRATTALTAVTLLGVVGGTWFQKNRPANPFLEVMSEDTFNQYSYDMINGMIALPVVIGALRGLGLFYAGYQAFTKKAVNEDKEASQAVESKTDTNEI